MTRSDEKDDRQPASQAHTHTHTSRLTESVLGVVVLGGCGCDDISPHTRSSLHLYLAHLVGGEWSDDEKCGGRCDERRGVIRGVMTIGREAGREGR